MRKKLYRSRTDRKLAGILGGFGEYLGVDPTLLRVLFVILSIVTVFFPFALAYLICAFIIPNDDGVIS
ncbi:PspC domain-containing protein [Calidifontibacillus oryziterrae]|uniref:PspC domain-containing protein n=1 Tax=Calidifontibacillus oryziterrae TaxID=1191699 RepID=UPI0002F41843|nr:PspC domain-containing protein [Calidifontibacillus oryziterrae]